MNNDWKQKELKPDKNPTTLSEEDLEGFLSEFPKWKLITDPSNGTKKLTREIQFPSFLQAFSYISKIALLSEKLDHHAEIYNSYGLVKLSIFTHTSLNLTNLDRTFAYQSEMFL